MHTRRVEKLKAVLEGLAPDPVKKTSERVAAVRRGVLERVVNAFFPTNSSGNNASRG